MADTETAGHGAVPEAHSASLVGQIVDGRYRIHRKLGSGDMGEVYAVEHTVIGKPLAMKVLYRGTASSTTAVTRYFRQARSASWIGHRNIAAVVDFGQLADGRPYVCMELLAGGSLRGLITPPMGVDRLLSILMQAGQGLAAAHARGIVHRDLKPENIFVTFGPDGDVAKLLDFGIADASDSDDPPTRTRAGSVRDTPFYVAPEQALGRPLDARTDIYALGAIMYECFTGTPPFQSDSPIDVVLQRLRTEPEPVEQRAARAGRELPPSLAETIMRCLQKDPAQRFQTMDELIAALGHIPRHTMAPGGPLPTTGSRGVPSGPYAGPSSLPGRLESGGPPMMPSLPGRVESGGPPTSVSRGLPGGVEIDRQPMAMADSAEIPVPPAPLAVDENVQFTAYRPRAIAPLRWYSLLVFAHLAERRPGELDTPDPIDEVRRQAEAVLGERADTYQSTTQDGSAAIPGDGELVFVVEIPGVEVNPPRHSFRWNEPVHRVEFRIRATAQLVGTTARGRLTVFLGCLVIAELPLAVRVDAAPATGAVDHTQVRTYRKIFASYSHRDRAIVDQFERYARALGDEYLRDSIQLRSGEVWNYQLLRMIEQADAFQLFWSHNSMHSIYVRREYEYALSLNRPSFVRPTYWEEPMPKAEGLPPEALRRLHFQKLGGGGEAPQATSTEPSAREMSVGRTILAGPPGVPTSGQLITRPRENLPEKRPDTGPDAPVRAPVLHVPAIAAPIILSPLDPPPVDERRPLPTPPAYFPPIQDPGTPVPPTLDPSSTMTALSPARSDRRWLVLAVVVLAILILCVLLFWMF